MISKKGKSNRPCRAVYGKQAAREPQIPNCGVLIGRLAVDNKRSNREVDDFVKEKTTKNSEWTSKYVLEDGLMCLMKGAERRNEGK